MNTGNSLVVANSSSLIKIPLNLKGGVVPCHFSGVPWVSVFRHHSSYPAPIPGMYTKLRSRTGIVLVVILAVLSMSDFSS